MHLFRLTAASCNPLATNQIIIVIMDIERILKTRENAIYYGIGEYQKTALVGLVEMLQLVLMISIYRTKIISILSNISKPFKSQQANIYFTPEFDVALEYNTYPDCKLLLVEHELSSQSKSDRYKHPEIDEIYSIYEMSTEKDMPEKIVQSNLGVM